MVYRKGELSPAGVDRGWPHQVALQEELCGGRYFEIHKSFNEGRSLCSRGHHVHYEPYGYRVFCYADKKDAEAFLWTFGGTWFDHRERGKGIKWMHWYKGRLSGRPAGTKEPERAGSRKPDRDLRDV